MASTVQQLREAVAAKLEAAIDGASVHAYVDVYVTPAVLVIPSQVEYDNTFGRGGDEWLFTVRALARGLDRSSQMFLDELASPIGTRSVKRILEADQTLGGTANAVHVRSMQEYQEYAFDGRAAVVGCEFTVFIEADGE